MPGLSSKVEWQHLSQPAFDRIVEALLIRHHQEQGDGSVAEAIDGRGGDGGRDVDVHQDGELTRVYQLKFFPEGFSGGHAKTRKPQIRSSFTTAMKDFPPSWVLVLPRNPTRQEREWVKGLRQKRNVRIDVWGSARLDAELAKFPELALWAVRDNTFVALMQQTGQEKAALVGPGDLRERAQALSVLANSRSQYWGVRVHTDERGGTTETLVAKRPDAAEKEPIALNLVIDPLAMDQDERAKFERLSDYGVGEAVIDETAVRAFTISGPDWIAGEQRPATFHARSLSEGSTPVVLVACDERDRPIASRRGAIVSGGTGAKGGGLEVIAPGGVRVTVIKPHDTPGGTIDLAFNPAGHDAEEALTGMEFLTQVASTNRLEIKQGSQLMFRALLEGDGERPGNPYVDQLVEDLAFIAREMHTPLDIPHSLSAEERFEIRRLRLVLEGYVVYEPAFAVLTGKLNGETSPELEEQIRAGFALAVVSSSIAYSVLGHEFVVRDLCVYSPAVRVEDSEELVGLLQAGDAADREVIARSVSGLPFATYLPEVMTRLGRPHDPVPLNVAGHSEPVPIDA
jgi:hypothetical protein